MHTTLTIPKWAESVGISKQAGYRAIQRCGIPVADGQVDPEVATLLYRQRTRQRANSRREALAHPFSAADATSYDEARRRRERAEAAIAELRLAEMAGALVLREAVNRLLFTAARVMRDQMLAIAPRLAATLSAVTDPALIEARISAEVRVGLAAFAQQTRAGGFPEAGETSANPSTDLPTGPSP